MPTGAPVPLAGWAERQIRAFAESTGAAGVQALSGAGLLIERAAINGFAVPGAVSAGGGCQLIRARDGWVAIGLARMEDRTLLPALFDDGRLDPDDDGAIRAAMALGAAAQTVERGREMGLALAHLDEAPASPAATITATAESRRSRSGPPLVVDLSALWAGPLAGHLLWLAGARVVKVESRTRPDAMREGDPMLFALLNQGKSSVAIDLRDDADRNALIRLIRRADIVLEAARPRALRQLGIDADAMVREKPGLTWITITGHGVAGDAGNWVGFGDDCGVAGGLSAALRAATGTIGFVGDAIADPLTGLAAANAARRGWASGGGGRTILSMSGTVRAAIDEAGYGLNDTLRRWATSVGHPFPALPARQPTAPVAALGQDNPAWLGAPC